MGNLILAHSTSLVGLFNLMFSFSLVFRFLKSTFPHVLSIYYFARAQLNVEAVSALFLNLLYLSFFTSFLVLTL